jgi:hypothetical protein
VKKQLISIALLSTVASTSASADSGFYLGASAGNATIDGTVPGTSVSFDESDTAFKAFVGFRLISLVAIEGGYVDFGKPTGSNASVDLTGVDLFGVLNLPVGPINLFAKAGVFQWETDTTAAGVSQSNDGNDLAYGVGAAIRFGSLGVRAEYELFDISDFDTVAMYSLGLEYSF